jgi:hypothetical protein
MVQRDTAQAYEASTDEKLQNCLIEVELDQIKRCENLGVKMTDLGYLSCLCERFTDRNSCFIKSKVRSLSEKNHRALCVFHPVLIQRFREKGMTRMLKGK